MEKEAFLTSVPNLFGRKSKKHDDDRLAQVRVEHGRVLNAVKEFGSKVYLMYVSVVRFIINLLFLSFK